MHAHVQAHMFLPVIVYFALSEWNETPENHISKAAGRPSPKETGRQREREREGEREIWVGVIQAYRAEVPVIFHNRDR